ncbi:MAG: hypothetical protein OEL20_15220 [Sulfuritalea sp.]|nr:hypothetical protein [Sulfuritalea sp.]
MNDDETSRLRPEHLAKWLQRSREYLLAPRADLSNVEVIESAMHHPVSQFHCSRSVLLSWAQRALAHALKRGVQGEANPLKALERGFYFQVSLMAKHPSVPLAILAWYSQTADARVRSRIRNTIGCHEKRLSRLIGRAQQQGLVRPNVDAISAAAALVGLIQNLVLGMSTGTKRPELLLRDAATAFPVYLDTILAVPTSRRDSLFN